MTEKKQSKTEKRNNEETQTHFPEICLSPSSSNKEEILSKYLRIEADLSVDMVRKMESLIIGASNGYLFHSCKNMKNNLNFLQKELLVKNGFTKSLLETQTPILNSLSSSTSKPVSLLSSRNSSIQNEEEDMENKADEDKYKIYQSELKQENNMSELCIGNLNLGIKELIL